MRSPSSPQGYDVVRWRWLAGWLRMPSWQFQVTLPNQVLFWVVIVVGLVGPSDPWLNFATTITWFVWFCVVFVLIVTTGRGWCAMCPFGGLAEWVQRRAVWHHRVPRRPLGLNRPFPDRLGRYGFLLPVAMFALLTWVEEFLDIAAPGDPPLTSAMVLMIIALALASFLVFERRSFCRYLCPLSSLIGAIGQQAPLAGFRARDRQVCAECTTRDCLHGNERGYGCPWFNWPGSAETNLGCGLCGECFRACPSGNVGLFVQAPLTGLSRGRRRGDVGWAIAWLAGIVVFQQVNATDAYRRLDDGLNAFTGLAHYPNPLDYLGIVGLVVLAAVAPAWLASRTLVRATAVGQSRGDSFAHRTSRFRTVFLPLMYAAAPLVAADYLARQLPKFFGGALAVIPAAGRVLGIGPGGTGGSSGPADVALAGPHTVVAVQVVVVVVGTLASAVLAARTFAVELRPVLKSPGLAATGAAGFIAAAGALTAWLYVLIEAAP